VTLECTPHLSRGHFPDLQDVWLPASVLTHRHRQEPGIGGQDEQASDKGGALWPRETVELGPVRQPAYPDPPPYVPDPPSADHTCWGHGRPADDPLAVGVKGEIAQAVKAALLLSRRRVPQDHSVFVSRQPFSIRREAGIPIVAVSVNARQLPARGDVPDAKRSQGFFGRQIAMLPGR
jgi:hypothetical protein